MEFVDPNVFETANAGFAQVMYEEFLRDPAAVGPEWRRLFESGIVGERPGAVAERAPARPRRRPPVRHRRPPWRLRPPPAAALPARRLRHQGPRGQARRQHEREPDRPHRHHLPRAAGRRAGGEAARGSTRRSQAAGTAGEDLVHPPHRLRAGPGHQAASGDGPHAGHARRRRRTASRPKASRSAWRWTCSGRTAAAASSCR